MIASHTYTGQRIDLENPDSWVFNIDDICHSLAMQCRYAGRCVDFYPISEHLYLGSEWLKENGYDKDTQRNYFVHDFSEGILQDLITPIKRRLVGYDEIETSWENAISVYTNTDFRKYPIVKEIDRGIMKSEITANMMCKDFSSYGLSDDVKAIKVKFQFGRSKEFYKSRFMSKWFELFY